MLKFGRHRWRNQDATVKRWQQVLSLDYHKVPERSSIGDDNQLNVTEFAALAASTKRP